MPETFNQRKRKKCLILVTDWLCVIKIFNMEKKLKRWLPNVEGIFRLILKLQTEVKADQTVRNEINFHRKVPAKHLQDQSRTGHQCFLRKPKMGHT